MSIIAVPAGLYRGGSDGIHKHWHVYGVAISGSGVWSSRMTLNSIHHGLEAVPRLETFRKTVKKGSKGSILFVLLAEKSRLSHEIIRKEFKGFDVIFLTNNQKYNFCYDPSNTSKFQ